MINQLQCFPSAVAPKECTGRPRERAAPTVHHGASLEIKSHHRNVYWETFLYCGQKIPTRRPLPHGRLVQHRQTRCKGEHNRRSMLPQPNPTASAQACCRYRGRRGLGTEMKQGQVTIPDNRSTQFHTVLVLLPRVTESLQQLHICENTMLGETVVPLYRTKSTLNANSMW